MKLWTICGVVQSASSFLADRHVKGIVLVQRQHSIFAQETASQSDSHVLTSRAARPGRSASMALRRFLPEDWAPSPSLGCAGSGRRSCTGRQPRLCELGQAPDFLIWEGSSLRSAHRPPNSLLMDPFRGPGPGGCGQTWPPSWCSEPVGNMRTGQEGAEAPAVWSE